MKILFMNASMIFRLTIMLLLIIIIMVRWIFLHTKNMPGELFAEAQRYENKGDYEAAYIAYNNALQEVKKNRFFQSSIKNKIVEKLKVLNTVIAYKNSSDSRQEL